MGIKSNGKGNRFQDAPGPGEYETDVQPLHHANTASIIGTGMRSDLGVGKAHLSPGPGQYLSPEKNAGPAITFGSEKKKTKVRKTYAPGPGSYDLPGTVGNIPKYLMNSKNVAA